MVNALTASMDVAVVELPLFDDLDAPLHGLVQLASHAGTLEPVLDRAGEGLTSRRSPVWWRRPRTRCQPR